MQTKLLLAKLAIERCQQDLTHLCAVTHLASAPDEEEHGLQELRHQTILKLIRSMNHELVLMQANIEGTLEAARE